MLIEKKIIFRAGLLTHELWLCVVALQKYLKITNRKSDQERTFYSSKMLDKIFIREREKCIYIKYIKFREKPKYFSRKAIVIGNERGKHGVSKM